jgi:hypothetical protein
MIESITPLCMALGNLWFMELKHVEILVLTPVSALNYLFPLDLLGLGFPYLGIL